MKPIEYIIKDISLGGEMYTIMMRHLMRTNDGIFDHQLNTIYATKFNTHRAIKDSLVYDINNLPHL